MTAAAGQGGPVDQTAACEANRHYLCRGTVLSLTAAHGAPCNCTCHLGDDRAVEAVLEAHHFNDPFDGGYRDA